MANSTELRESISERFERTVVAGPDRPALRTPRASFTYGELDAEADRVASALLAHGIRDGARVAVLVERPEVLVPCLLGILKSGNVYVPLDPAYPHARIVHALDDSDSAVVLAEPGTIALAADVASGRCGVVDACATVAAEGTPERPRVEVPPDALAYLIYTSGSTGEPKGVTQTHENLLEFVRNYSKPFGIGPDDRLTLFYSPSFSASLMDIFGALLNGAALLPYPVKELGVAGLEAWLERERLTIFHAVPTLFRQFVESLGERRASATVRGVDLGGEPVTSNDVTLFENHFADRCVLVNHYAATEVSVIAQHVVTKRATAARGLLPVGMPADGLSVAIVDGERIEVPRGTPGQIVVRGARLSPGYWKRPALTEAAFGRAPSDPNVRMYFTGDLGRMGESGVLEHLGRIDARVKIRGHSVEVAETEAALLALDAFREVAVVARDDGRAAPRLVAYLVPRNGQSPPVDRLRARLAESLPEYMVPSSFVTLDRLPVTPNGKLDRRALPDPNGERPRLDVPPVPPRGDVERSLVAIWQDVLGVSPVGVDDSFFDLGGDSIRAVRMCYRVREKFGLVIPQTALLRAPTIAGFAAIVRGEVETPADTLLLSVQAGGTERPLFIVHGLSGGIMFSWDIARAVGPERPVYAIQAVPRPDFVPGVTRIEDLATEYLELIRTVQPRGPFAVSGFSLGGVIAFEMARQLVSAGERVAFLGLLDAHAPGYPKLHPVVRRALEHVTALYELPREKWLGYVSKRLRFARTLVRRRIGRSRAAKPSDGRPRTQAMYETLRLAARAYAPAPYTGEAHLFRAALRVPVRRPDPEHGWGPLVAGGLRVQAIPGHHLSCIREPNVSVVARSFADALAESECGGTNSEKGGTLATAHASLR